MDDIEQVTDYDESDNDQDDAYSIVSTPKPKLQPFFTSTNQLNFKDSTVLINKFNSDFNAFGGLSASSNSLNVNKQDGDGNGENSNEKLKLTQKIEHKLMNITSNNDVFVFIDEYDALMTHFNQELNFESHLLLKNCQELNVFYETIAKLAQTDSFTKFNRKITLVIIGNDQCLNRYVQSYVAFENEILGTIIRHFFVPRKNSILASHIGRLNSMYYSMFCDDFWTKLDESIVESRVSFKEIWKRLTKYVLKNDANVISFPIGECLIGTSIRLETDTYSSSSSGTKISLSIPFVCDVRIKLPGLFDETKPITFSASNSTSQFSTNKTENESTFAYKNDR